MGAQKIIITLLNLIKLGIKMQLFKSYNDLQHCQPRLINDKASSLRQTAYPSPQLCAKTVFETKSMAYVIPSKLYPD